MKTPEQDRLIGVDGYLSQTEGMGGRIKDQPEDFLVEEITPDNLILEIGKELKPKASEGDYTTLTLEKTNWDVMRAIKALAKGCNVSRKRFKFAGTKDRRAITTQRISAWKVPIETLEKVSIKDLVLRDFSHSEEPINLGSLNGNRFTILIKDVVGDADKRINKTLSELNGKFPNFFGHQRFGSRLNTHLVGKAILKGEFKEAAMIYLADPGNSSEPKEALEARKRFKEKEDFGAALTTFPKYLGYEKSMLNHLVKHPNDYVGAFREMPKKLRWLFIHAYQAYVFNLSLSEYMKKKNIPDELPLVGYECAADEISKKVLKKEKIEREAFKTPSMPELASKGENRAAICEYKDFEIMDFKEKDSNIRVRFVLSSGSYATMLLRELIKN